MKKLMIAACAIALGVVAQAATVSWDFKASEALHDGTSSGLISSGTAYFINSALAQNTFLTDVRTGVDFSGSVLATATVGSDGKFLQAFDVDAGTSSLSGYLAVVMDGKVFIGVTEAFSKDPLAEAAPYGTVKPALATTKKFRDKEGTASFGSAGWYATVPEPTSGLLLLLGVAGLALRRRRA